MFGASGAWQSAGYCAVSFFLFISGYFSYFSDTTDRLQFYKKKALRILPIYYVSLVVALIETVPIRSFWTIEGAKQIVAAVLMVDAYNIAPSYYLNPPTWFLAVLVLFYALLPWLQKGLKRRPRLFVGMFIGYAITVVAVTWIGYGGAYFARVNMPFMRICECILGMVCAHYFAARPRIGEAMKATKGHRVASVVGLLVFLTFSPILPNAYVRPYMAIPVMAYLALAFIHTQGGSGIGKLHGLGKYSMAIYMFHMVVAMGLVRCYDLCGMRLPNALSIGLVYGLTFAVAFVWERYCSEWIYRKIGGER